MNDPSWRKPAGVLLILAWIVLWAALVLRIPRPAAWPLQLAWFAGAGLIWIAPLKPLLRWMESGKWRE